MESITNMINNYGAELAIGVFAFLLCMLLIVVILIVNVYKMKKKYKLMFKGEKVNNVEEMLLLHKIDVENIKKNHNAIEHHIGRLEKGLSIAFSKSAIYKYDAFSGLAGKLSFVYVLLDSVNSGVILNGIYSNEGHYLYIKDVVNGKTDKELSKEERGTLEKAIANVR